MTLIIENVKDEFVPAFRDLAKSAQADIKENQSREIPNQETLEAMRESEDILQEIKAGKRKPFENWAEAKKALLA
ncbi:hypothetical protein [Helicobacter sp. 11S02596-1]|uniref:hypothetical protein n=1 Tax=Helicobacter sp. 11S02596-1 TaxID=1476194 RepID=UPI000BA6311A|nr:hypothetical protein [Helicobacter sp. 11S02596-1]PAF42503.1 hypothetical protein BJI48_06810 [Helicobacter sp. 11S02596-1]